MPHQNIINEQYCGHKYHLNEILKPNEIPPMVDSMTSYKSKLRIKECISK